MKARRLVSLGLGLIYGYALVVSVKPRVALAEYAKAYQDYVYNYQVYRNAFNDFQVAKSSYLTYRTLTAQNEAVDKFRTVLKARDQAMAVYFNLLQEKLNATTGVENSAKDTFNTIKESEKSWLDGNQKKIDAAASLDDLNSISQEFDGRFLQMNTETRQTIGTVLLAKESDLKGQLDGLIGSLVSKLSEMRQGGVETSPLDRGVISSRSKLELYLTKYAEAHDVYFPQNSYSGSSVDLFRGQQKLSEANQYLRETVNYLLEVVKGITG